ncbi:MAG: VOC family protein [Acidobacteriota bacterium]
MAGKVSYISEGRHSVSPSLIVRDPTAAIDFYEKVFAATQPVPPLTDGEGKIMHAEIKIGDSMIMLSPEAAEWGNQSPETLGGTAVSIHVYVEDADTVFQKAIDAGAKVRIPIQDQFYGDRSGRLEDPFGHLWIIATHTEDMSPQEMQKRCEEFMKGMKE